MSQDIINRILRDKSSLTSYKSLLDINVEVKKELIKHIVRKIKTRFEERGFLEIRTINLDNDKGLLISFQTTALAENNLRLGLNFESSDFRNLIIGFQNISVSQPKDLHLLQLFTIEFPEAKHSLSWPSYIVYYKYRDWIFSILTDIYFDTDNAFYKDLESKVDRMLAVLESKSELSLVSADLTNIL